MFMQQPFPGAYPFPTMTAPGPQYPCYNYAPAVPMLAPSMMQHPSMMQPFPGPYQYANNPPQYANTLPPLSQQFPGNTPAHPLLSPGPAFSEELPSKFPLIKDWLLRLDETRQEEDKIYAQYIPLFESLKMSRIIEIGDKHSMTALELVSVSKGVMPFGHANLIIQGAKRDIEWIRYNLKRNNI
jgi:hypothetical protein